MNFKEKAIELIERAETKAEAKFQEQTGKVLPRQLGKYADYEQEAFLKRKLDEFRKWQVDNYVLPLDVEKFDRKQLTSNVEGMLRDHNAGLQPLPNTKNARLFDPRFFDDHLVNVLAESYFTSSMINHLVLLLNSPKIFDDSGDDFNPPENSVEVSKVDYYKLIGRKLKNREVKFKKSFWYGEPLFDNPLNYIRGALKYEEMEARVDQDLSRYIQLKVNYFEVLGEEVNETDLQQLKLYWLDEKIQSFDNEISNTNDGEERLKLGKLREYLEGLKGGQNLRKPEIEKHISAPPPIASKEPEIREILTFLGNIHPQEGQLLTHEELERLVRYVLRMLETNALPENIEPINPAKPPAEIIRYAIYGLHVNLTGKGRDLAYPYIEFLQKVFPNKFAAWDSKTLRKNFSKKPDGWTHWSGQN